MKKMIATYKELIQELNEEVSEGILKMEDTIQILRSEQPIVQDYCPIREWYYDAFVMEEELETPVEEMYMKEEFSSHEWEQMLKEQEEYKMQYRADQESLKEITVKAAVTEMNQMLKLFKG